MCWKQLQKHTQTKREGGRKGQKLREKRNRLIRCDGHHSYTLERESQRQKVVENRKLEKGAALLNAVLSERSTSVRTVTAESGESRVQSVGQSKQLMMAAFQRRVIRRGKRRWWIRSTLLVAALGAVHLLVDSYSATRHATTLAEYGQHSVAASSASSTETVPSATQIHADLLGAREALEGERVQQDDHAHIRNPSSQSSLTQSASAQTHPPPTVQAKRTPTTARVFGNTPGKDWPKIIDDFIDIYRKSANSSIHVHTQSWNRFVAHEMDTRPDDQVNSDQEEANMLERFPYLQQLLQATSQPTNGTNTARSIEPLIWDKEEAIDDYFQTIADRCSRSFNALEDETFMKKCWGTIAELVHGPRCTLRLDSRYVCDGPRGGEQSEGNSASGTSEEAASSASAASASGAEPIRQYTAEQIIQQHFTEATLNVVIIGAGPVGLQLANILNHAKTRNSIRILVFENRVEHPGRKMPYSRDWCTYISFEAFHRGDRRIVRYFDQIIRRQNEKETTDNVTFTRFLPTTDSIFRDGGARHVNLPLMIIETVLLMSNRDLGVKFLYEDIRTHRHLLEAVPNLVVFDASGHRLAKLERSNVHPDTPVSSFTPGPMIPNGETPPLTVTDWSPDEAVVEIPEDGYPWYFIDWSEYDPLKDLNFLTKVATKTTAQGTVMYPVTPQGAAFRLRMMEFEDFRYARRLRGMFSGWHTYMKELMQSSHPLCSEKFCDQVQGINCDDYCALSYGWDSSVGYRPDIFKAIKDTWPYFSTMLVTLSLSADQHDILDFIYRAFSTKSMAVRNLPIASMLPKKAFRRNNMIYTLIFLGSHAGLTFPAASLFTYTPYIYADVVVPLTAETGARIGTAPLLRIGDSLSTGHSNLGSGLTQHIAIMEKLARALETFKI